MWKPKWIQSWAQLYKDGGVKHLLKQKGWKVVFVFFTYYLIRDSILYILIPWLGYNHFSSCF